MYAILCTRPNISFVFGLVSYFRSNHGPTHWSVIERVLRYLRGTTDFVLCYGGPDLLLHGYTDADYASDLDEQILTSKSTFLLIEGHISRCSEKQLVVALLTMKVK